MTHRIAELTAPEVARRLAAGAAVLFPMGSLETHRRLRAMRLEAAHGEDHGGTGREATRHLGSGQLRDAPAHGRSAGAICPRPCAPMQRVTGRQRPLCSGSWRPRAPRPARR